MPFEQLSASRRAPGLALSPEHLYLARAGPVCDAGTLSSGFLSPPLIGPGSMSPPPKEEADDYLNVRGRRSHRRKHGGMQERRHYNTREDPEASSPCLRSPASGTRVSGATCEPCGASSRASDIGSLTNSSVTLSAKQLKLSTNIKDTQYIKSFIPQHMPTWSRIRPSVNENEDLGSPAMNALRSLSQPASPDVEPQTLRRMSSALAATLGFSKPRRVPADPSEPFRISNKGLETARERRAHRNFAIRNGPSWRSTFKNTEVTASILDIPATITLRKASNVYAPTQRSSSMTASIVNEGAHTSELTAPGSELLAFYSTPIAVIEDLRIDERLSPQTANSPSSLKIEASSNPISSPCSARKGSLSVVKSKNSRRCSFPAKPVMTFADVHVAPGSFAVEARSRKPSLVRRDTIRRISVVHFRSRNSVHEVIWREDETASSSSLSSNSTSPPHFSHSPRSDTLYLESTSSLIQKPGSAKEKSGPLPIAPARTPSVGKPLETLFHWSWEELSPSVPGITNEALGAGQLTSCYDLSLTRRQCSTQDERSKASSSNAQSVESFPPLLERNSTAEWRKAPLVDLDDPLAGRTQQFHDQENKYFTGQGACIPRMPSFGTSVETSALEHRPETSGTRRLSSHPYAPSGAGPGARVGSSIGASSHVRIWEK